MFKKNTKDTIELTFPCFLVPRHPSKNAPINLIHQHDCIGIITAIIEQNFWGEKINASTPFHPTRKEYYTSKAKELGLELPQFEESDDSGKVIDSSKLVAKLGYGFIYVGKI